MDRMMARIRIGAFLSLITPLTLVMMALQWLALHFKAPLARTLPVVYHRCVCRLLRLTVTVRGDVAAHRPLLLLSNHTSWLDIVALSSVMPVSFIAKSEVGTWPIFGTFARLQRSIFIDRKRRMATIEANKRVADRLLAGDAIVLFAEGTTSDGNRVLSFRSSLVGAAGDALGGVEGVVQPVTIIYPRRSGLPILRQERPDIAWYGDMELVPHFAGILAGGPIEAEISFGSPIATGSCFDRKFVTREAEAVIRRTASERLRGCAFA